MRVIVSWANEPEPREFDWPSTMLVGVAASEAREAFGIKDRVARLATLGGEILGDVDPLCVAGVVEGAELEIIPIGGAV